MGGWDAPWHWVVIAILVIALFGYKKLPDAARSLGRSLRIFKSEIKGMSDDDKARAKAREDAEQPPAPRALPPAEVVKNDTAANVSSAPSTNGTANGTASTNSGADRPRPTPNGRPASQQPSASSSQQSASQ